MDKVAVTRCLRAAGASLNEAFDATNRVLEGERVEVVLPTGTDLASVRTELDRLGVVLG